MKKSHQGRSSKSKQKFEFVGDRQLAAPSQRNALEFWHSDGSVKSIWHSFGTMGGEIGQMKKQSVGKFFIIFTYFMSGRSAAW